MAQTLVMVGEPDDYKGFTLPTKRPLCYAAPRLAPVAVLDGMLTYEIERHLFQAR